MFDRISSLSVPMVFFLGPNVVVQALGNTHFALFELR